MTSKRTRKKLIKKIEGVNNIIKQFNPIIEELYKRLESFESVFVDYVLDTEKDVTKKK